MNETIHFEEHKVGELVELVAYAYFHHDYRDDPHEDEAIVSVQAPSMTPKLKSWMEAHLRKEIADHRAGDIR